MGRIRHTYQSASANDAAKEVSSTRWNADHELIGVGIVALTSSAGVVTVDLSAGEHFTLALTENVTSWVFNNLPAAGFMSNICIDITQHASTAKTVVSPASVGSTSGGVWVQSATLSAMETLGLRVTPAGTKLLYPSGVLA